MSNAHLLNSNQMSLISSVRSSYKVTENDFSEIVKDHIEDEYPEKLEGGKHTNAIMTKMHDASFLSKTSHVTNEMAT